VLIVDTGPLVTTALVIAYADLRLGGTDASVIAVSERLGIMRFATLNHHHFRTERPKHCDAFELLPWCSSARSVLCPAREA
jgi:hypothetical protein